MAVSKSERTTQYIIEKVAPVFNKKGYIGTSMSDLFGKDGVTGLSKGAITGKFNKEELALAAFNYSLMKVMQPLGDKLSVEPTGIGKLKAITSFYRHYHQTHIEKLGGCPVLNMGVHASHQNPQLFARAIDVIEKLKSRLVEMINLGKEDGTLRKDLAADTLASRIYSMLQGSIFMATTMNSSSYLVDMTDHIDHMIDTEMAK